MISHALWNETNQTVNHLKNEIESLHFLVDELFRELRQAREQNDKDELTGALRRKRFLEELELTMKQSRNTHLIMIDVDNFKKFNDQYGHILGDQVLKTLVSCGENILRANEKIGRYGGEEFMIMTPNGFQRAMEISEALRAALKDVRIPNVPEAITISVGVGSTKSPANILADIEKVDKLMYMAKRSGKDRVIGEQQ